MGDQVALDVNKGIADNVKESVSSFISSSKDDIINKLNELYNNTSKLSFEKLNTPINIYQQREQTFRKYREEKIDFIKFDYDNMEGTVYDFKIGNLRGRK